MNLKSKSGHEYSDPSLLRYLDDIRKTSPVSRKSEQELFRLCRQGNQKARTVLISSNMRFVLKVALNYRGCPIPLADLVSIGAIGLVKAIEKFDHTRGLKFISYAVWWIKAYITKALNEEGSLIRLPANQYMKIRKALNVRNNCDIDDEIRELINLARKGHSIDAPVNDESATTYAEIFPDANAERSDFIADRKGAEKFTRELLSELSPREAGILRCLYGIDHDNRQTLREVGDSLNLSHERVRQLRDQALSKLKNSRHKDLIRENLDAQIESAR